MSPPDDQARRLLGAAIDVDAELIPVAAAIGNFERWDSLSHMRLILGLEEFLDRRLESQEIIAIGNIADIERLITNHADRDRG